MVKPGQLETASALSASAAAALAVLVSPGAARGRAPQRVRFGWPLSQARLSSAEAAIGV